MRVRSALAAVSVGLLSVALSSGHAHAAPTHGGQNVSGAGAIAAQDEAAAPVWPHVSGPADCNVSLCVHSANVGVDYEVWAEFRVNVTKGRFHIWGPRLDVTTPESPWRAGQNTRRYRGHGSGRVCAEGWSYSGGRWHSLGQSCVATK
ncbi:hypothetical protein [Actinoplanes regularis]|uniref:hypothetical protein n=1 Tax=Actinoplanes regularis TaxID=52697 RepID=UPI0024A433B0|nr:hypothetical protein [Actinoplanes regularis]GLW34927.1 hypothetical protein Areg01_78630 [Actinoplanes regularis]